MGAGSPGGRSSFIQVSSDGSAEVGDSTGDKLSEVLGVESARLGVVCVSAVTGGRQAAG